MSTTRLRSAEILSLSPLGSHKQLAPFPPGTVLVFVSCFLQGMKKDGE